MVSGLGGGRDKIRIGPTVGTWQLKGTLTLNLWGLFLRRLVCREEGRADGQREERPRDEKEKDISGCLSRPREASLQYPK